MLVYKLLKKRLKNLPVFYKIALFLFCAPALSKQPRCYVVDSPKYIGGAGFFHNFNIVLGYLDLYDRLPSFSLKIDFGKEGLYYDQAKGENWWGYYFVKTDYPFKNKEKKIIFRRPSDLEKAEMGNATHFYMTPQRAFFLIQKYLEVKPEILEEVESFYKKHLEGYEVIGLHYRGTDKVLEATVVSYEEVKQRLLQVLPKKPYKIFVATDDPIFLKRLEEDFPETVHTDAERLENIPVHYGSSCHYQKGKEALIDCLLLSKSNLLLRCNSNLSAVSCFFNPEMPFMNLNSLQEDLYKGISAKGALNVLNKKLPIQGV